MTSSYPRETAVRRWRARCREAIDTGKGFPQKGPYQNRYAVPVQDALRRCSGYRIADHCVWVLREYLRKQRDYNLQDPLDCAGVRLALRWLQEEMKRG